MYPLHFPPVHISTFSSSHLGMLLKNFGIDKRFELVTVGQGATGEYKGS
jgi:hypothetical protein